MLQNINPSPPLEYHETFWDYFNMETTGDISNVTHHNATIVAPEQSFVIAVYSTLLAAGAVGNVGVFASLVRSRRRKSRVNLLMTHLVVADMIVTFIVIPLEIGWRTTNAWLAGNLACKFFLVLRAFGLYLSSNVLVCISLDRFFAILYPLRLPIARKRSKMMLSFAWLIALLCSLPQILPMISKNHIKTIKEINVLRCTIRIIHEDVVNKPSFKDICSLVFRVMTHPDIPDFEQCVSFEAFNNHHHELAYNVFCLCAMYFLPLTIISVCYACIFYEISKNSKENSEKYHQSDHSRVMLRRSDQRPLARARRRTLRMTVTIVTVFACCWLPYATMTLWYMLDRKSAEHVSKRVQDLFFIMAVSNSCMDPLVYGSYALDPRIFTRTFRKVFCIHTPTSDIPGITGPGTTKSKIPDAETTQQEKIRLNCVRRNLVHFEEVSSVQPTVNSDPVPFWCEHTSGDQSMRPSRSCEVFVVHTIQTEF